MDGSTAGRVRSRRTVSRLRPSLRRADLWRERRPLALVGVALALITLAAYLLARVVPHGAVAGWLFLPLILVVSLRWGRTAGIASTLLAGLMLLSFATPPAGAPRSSATEDYLALLISLGGTLVVVLLVSHLNRRRLEAETETREELESLLISTAKLGVQLEPEAVYRTVAEEAAALLNAEQSLYAIAHDGCLWAAEIYVDGSWQALPEGAPPALPVENSILGLVLETGLPYRTNALQSDPHTDRQRAQKLGLHSMLAVPLRGPEGEALGSVGVFNSRRRGGFSDQDERVLAAFSEHASAMLRRARDTAGRFEAERQAARRKQEVEVLLGAATQLYAAATPEDVLQRVVELAVELVGPERSTVVLNRGDHALIWRSWHDGAWELQGERVPLEGSLGGWVMQRRQSYLAGSPDAASRFQWNYQPVPKLSVMGVPVTDRDGKVIAALALIDRADGRPFGEADLRLVEGIVRHGAIALERATLLEELRANEQRFRSLVHHTSEIIAVHDGDRRLRYISPAVERVLGYSAAELTGRNLGDLVHPGDRGTVSGLLARGDNRPGAEAHALCRILHRDGSWRYLEMHVTDLLAEPSVNGIVINYRDITERIELEEKLRRQAFTDALTGLPNRSSFMQDVARALCADSAARSKTVVLFLDLDGFKAVNDSLGHAVGDELLIAVAGRLQHGRRKADTVARFGGDEFAILLRKVQERAEAVAIADRIIADVREPFHLRDHEVSVTVSIGIAIVDSSAGEIDPEDVLRQADAALYKAKFAGKARAVVARA